MSDKIIDITKEKFKIIERSINLDKFTRKKLNFIFFDKNEKNFSLNITKKIKGMINKVKENK